MTYIYVSIDKYTNKIFHIAYSPLELSDEIKLHNEIGFKDFKYYQIHIFDCKCLDLNKYIQYMIKNKIYKEVN